MIIGIIGGKGNMGKYFTKYFRNNGFKVVVSDLDTKLTNKKLVEKSDIVVISVPINKTVEVIKEIIPYTRQDQLLMDLTSIKEPAMKVMLKSSCEILGTHPMFGPHIKSIKGQTVILCRARPRKKTKIIEQLFEKSNVNIKISTPKKHDLAMATLQGLTHFSAIVLGHCVKNLNLNLKDLHDYMSPIYDIRFGMIGRILAQDSELYAQIQLENPEIKKVLNKLEKSHNKLHGIIKKHNTKEFQEYFKDAANYFGPYKEKAMEDSNYLIQKIAQKKN